MEGRSEEGEREGERGTKTENRNHFGQTGRNGTLA